MKQSISILFQVNDNVDDINDIVYVVHGRICRTGNIAALPRVACYFSLQRQAQIVCLRRFRTMRRT